MAHISDMAETPFKYPTWLKLTFGKILRFRIFTARLDGDPGIRERSSDAVVMPKRPSPEETIDFRRVFLPVDFQ